jgi:hypothetical protein
MAAFANQQNRFDSCYTENSNCRSLSSSRLKSIYSVNNDNTPKESGTAEERLDIKIIDHYNAAHDVFELVEKN